MTPKTTLTPKLVGLDHSSLLTMYRAMILARTIDRAELRLKRQQKTFFQVSGAGHEAVQAAAGLLLKPAHDWFFPYYRDRTLALMLGVSPKDMLLQAMGKASDPSTGGREMPCHYGAPELQIVNQSSPTGTQYLQAVGVAEAGKIAAVEVEKRRRVIASVQPGVADERVGPPFREIVEVPPFRYDEVVYVSGGEGSTSQGEFYEAVSAACLQKLPVLFLVQDNKFAISVPVEVQTPGANVSALFRTYPHLFVEEMNGLDPVESYRVLRRALTHARSGKGPALVHAHVVRIEPHSDSDNDAAYKASSEKSSDLARDPIAGFETMLVQDGHAKSLELERLQEAVAREVEEAVSAALSEADPDPATAGRYVFRPEPVVRMEGQPEDEGEPLTMVDAVNRTLQAEMRRSCRVLVFGEDVADHSSPRCLEEVPGKGGVFKVTHGLQREFGEWRVYNTPIAEAAIVGRAFGLALRGFMPVVEIQFQDYIWPAMHQLRNEVALMRWRSNNSFNAPLVLRVPIGGYLTGGGPYHSQSAESIFCHSPGLRVVMPSNSRDAVGLLRTAMHCDEPVLFFEHKHLYRQSYARAPYPGDDYAIPLGKARRVRPGSDLTVVTYGAIVERSLRAARILADEGIEVEVLDLRSLAPYDWDAIVDSVRRTNRVVVAYEDNRTHGFGAELAARIADELFVELDAPVGRVGGLDAPVAYSPILEEATLPQVDDVISEVRRVGSF